jgi:hypothetical protein
MAGQFDAATDRVSRATAPNPALGLTWCGWVRIDVDLNDFSTFMRLHASTGGATTLVVGTGGDGTTPRVFSPSNTTGAVGTSMTVGTWYFVAYTYNPTGTAVTLYLGALGGGALATFSASVPPGTTPTGLTIAGRSSGDSSETTRGTFDNVRIWSGVLLNAAALEAERSSNTPVATSGLWANWPLTADLLDASGNGNHLSAGSTAISYVLGPLDSSGSTATLSATMPSFTASLTGVASAESDLNATLPAMVTQIDSEAASAAVIDATLPAFTAALAGAVVTEATLAAELPAMAAGLSAEAGASATLQTSLPAMGAALVAEAAGTGELAATLPAMGAALTGEVETEDNFFAIMPAFEAGLSGEASAEATLGATMPEMVAGFFSGAVSEGLLAADMPAMEANLTGHVYVESDGELIVTLPALIMTNGRGIRRMKEIERQRKVTRDFIMASPTFIALIPKQETRTPSGGVLMETAVARPVQVFRKIPMSHTERPNDSTSGISGTGGGTQRKYDMTLLGEWDATVQENDTWIDEDGQQYIVDALVPFNGYQVKALVMSYGRRAKTYG